MVEKKKVCKMSSFSEEKEVQKTSDQAACVFPPELVQEILSWIPADDLFRFRCVCKEWRTVIDDPGFAESQLLDMLFIRIKSKTYIMPLSCIDLDYPESRNSRTIEPIELDQVEDLTCAFGNPFINGQLVKSIPEYDVPDAQSQSIYPFAEGLGFDAATADHKFVRIVSVYSDTSEDFTGYKTIICSLKSGAWHSIKEDFPFGSFPFESTKAVPPGVFLNSALHWVVGVSLPRRNGLGTSIMDIHGWLEQVKYTLVVLDLTTEVYHEIPLPSIYTVCNSKLNVHAVGGYLFLTTICPLMEGDSLWILKDYGGENMWTMLVCSEFASDLRPVAYVKSKEQVIFRWNENDFMWYDVGKMEPLKRVTLNIMDRFSCQVFSASIKWLVNRPPKPNVDGGVDETRPGDSSSVLKVEISRKEHGF